MIREDAENLQRQLVHLFRVFEVEVAVGLHNKKSDYGVAIISQDPQVKVTQTSTVVKRAPKKDALSD